MQVEGTFAQVCARACRVGRDYSGIQKQARSSHVVAHRCVCVHVCVCVCVFVYVSRCWCKCVSALMRHMDARVAPAHMSSWVCASSACCCSLFGCGVPCADFCCLQGAAIISCFGAHVCVAPAVPCVNVAPAVPCVSVAPTVPCVSVAPAVPPASGLPGRPRRLQHRRAYLQGGRVHHAPRRRRCVCGASSSCAKATPVRVRCEFIMRQGDAGACAVRVHHAPRRRRCVCSASSSCAKATPVRVQCARWGVWGLWVVGNT